MYSDPVHLYCGCCLLTETNVTTCFHHVFVAPRNLRILSLSASGKSKQDLVFLFSIQDGRGGDDDYWGEGFDQNKNCEQEEKIDKLFDEVGVQR